MQIDRLIGILSILLQQDKVTAPYLAEKFEVSRRTINRDISTLCKAGIPIMTLQGAKGGISIMDGYRVDRTLLTSSDMQAILAGLKSLDSISGTKRYAQLMEKISAGTSNALVGGQHILIDLSSHFGSIMTEKIELIHKAIESEKTVTFRYFSLSGESYREIEPYYLIFRWSSWYVWGLCRVKKDYRLFKLGRMAELHTGSRFEKKQIAYPNLEVENFFPDRYQVKALISPKHKWRIAEEYGMDSFTEMEDGRLLFTFGQYDLDGALHFMLSFGTDAELLEPQELREALKKEVALLQKKYQS